MNMKKFIVIGLTSLCVLVGCTTTKETISDKAEKASSENVQTQALVSDLAAEAESGDEVETQVAAKTAEQEVDPVEESKKVAIEEIQTLASLIGKNSDEVIAILGEPSSTKNLEDTDILLVHYYKVDFLGETAKVEVIFNDDKQVVNYVSFTILSANDIEGTKENFASALTELYGESSIERIENVKGKRNRNWEDETLAYQLRYFENNIALNIYELDK